MFNNPNILAPQHSRGHGVRIAAWCVTPAVSVPAFSVGRVPRYISSLMTSREKLHLLVDDLSDAEAEAALARLVRERELLVRWTAPEDAEATEDAWALANAREAIREEPW